MQNFIRFGRKQLCSEKEGFYRHACHDPPHVPRVGFNDERSPPRRSAAVARSDPCKVTPALAFPGDECWRRRLPYPVGSDLWNNGRGKDWLRRDVCGEDCHPEHESFALAANTSGEDWLHHESLHRDVVNSKGNLVVQSICCNVHTNNMAKGNVPMVTPAKTLDQLNKVVVGFLHGARVKGYLHDFSALNESFNLLPQEDPLQGKEIKVTMKDLKAVFFVWEFTTKPEDHDSLHPAGPRNGRTIEVSFTDGEKIVGRSEGYNSQRMGFFMYPADPKGNNIRIFVVTKNTRQVRLV